MELKTIRTVFGANVTTFNRKDKVLHKKKETYKGTVIAKNQKSSEKQDLINSIQAKKWQSAKFNLSAKIKDKKQAKRLAMKQAGKAWKIKNQNK
ncbi:MAG TPA: hypothetical protein VLZ72_07905 [Flavobacterium sp.]|nr:hypothetical protein [Flavobacterium sp.]